MPTDNLLEAKKAKNDEFYTQYADIQKEINAYLEYDPDVFRGKTILLPCDDPEWSNFTKFFAQNFENFGLKKLISTSYAYESKKHKGPFQMTLFETEAPQFDANKAKTHGKIFILDHDTNQNGRIDIDDLQWNYLEGDGDFDSNEVRKLRDEADIIVTNPPFSLFRKFMEWIMEAEKKCILIANKNCVTYKEVFPLIKDNRLWVGRTSMSEDLLFEIPESMVNDFIEKGKEGSKYKIVNGKVLGRSSSIWLTNIDHGRRHQPLQLMTMEDNIKFSRHKDIKGKEYQHYDNYDAIEVPYSDAIPSDYDDVMGVPISFLDKYCPEQFEIIGISKTPLGNNLRTKIYPRQIQVNKKKGQSSVTKLNDGAALKILTPPEKDTYYIVEGELFVAVYPRVLIRKKR